MPTPKGGYWLDGKRLPSVTTVLWGYNPEGIDGLTYWNVNHALDAALAAWKQQRPFSVSDAMEYIKAQLKRAGDIGTTAHNAVEKWAKGEVPTFLGDPEIMEPAERAYSSFREWSERSKFKITHTEVGLTSSKFCYGGTIDALGYTGNGQRALADWKTSNHLNGKMLLQVAAYEQLWNENNPRDPIVGGIHLLRFNKTTGGFNDVWLPDAQNELQMFLNNLDNYQRYKETKKKLG